MKKLRPCLRCDKQFITTPEMRICAPCKESCGDKIQRHSTGYAGYQTAIGGMDYNQSYTSPVRTRYYE